MPCPRQILLKVVLAHYEHSMIYKATFDLSVYFEKTICKFYDFRYKIFTFLVAFEPDKHLEVNMVFWQRLLIAVLVMLAASFIVGLIWRSTFNMIIPSYMAGVIAGLAALPVWELLKRIKPKKEKNID